MTWIPHMHCFLGQPCGVLERLTDIICFQVRIGFDDFVNTHPVGTKLTIKDTVTRNPRMQARPPITFGSKVMRSNPSMEMTPFLITTPNSL